MTTRRLLAAFLLLAPGLALAQSEGVATFKIIAFGAHQDAKATPQGTYKIAFSKTAYRMDMKMDMSSLKGDRAKGDAAAPASLSMTTISKLADPDKVYMLNDQQKTYYVMDVARNREMAGHADDPWTVKRTGHDTVAGIPCEKATITSRSSTIDTCIATDFLVSSAWWSAMAKRQGGNDRWIKAMGDAGLKGFPIRMRYQSAQGADRVEMELVNLDRHGLPASMFEIPAGYKQTSMLGAMGMSPEQQKMMNDALAKMTPEQRKAYEDAMKKAQEKQ